MSVFFCFCFVVVFGFLKFVCLFVCLLACLLVCLFVFLLFVWFSFFGFGAVCVCACFSRTFNNPFHFVSRVVRILLK